MWLTYSPKIFIQVGLIFYKSHQYFADKDVSERFIKVWNATVVLWTSGQIDPLVEQNGPGISFADVRKLIVRSDRLKSLSRQVCYFLQVLKLQ